MGLVSSPCPPVGITPQVAIEIFLQEEDATPPTSLTMMIDQAITD
jgi:hypothetical protein